MSKMVLTLDFRDMEESISFATNLLMTVNSPLVSVLPFSSKLSTRYVEISHSPSVGRRTWLVFN